MAEVFHSGLDVSLTGKDDQEAMDERLRSSGYIGHGGGGAGGP